MKKIANLFIIAILLTSCNLKDNYNYEREAFPIEDIIEFNSYIIDISKTHYNYSSGIIEHPETEIMYFISGVDNDLNVFISKVVEHHSYENIEYAEIGIYNINNDEYKALLKGDVIGQGFGVLYVDDKYIVYIESFDYQMWYNYSFNLYIRETGESIKFFEPSIQPESGFVYKRFANNPVIIDDVIYFDDFYGFGKDFSDYYSRIYSYDIVTKEIEIVFENAENPMIYKGDLAFIYKSKEIAVFRDDYIAEMIDLEQYDLYDSVQWIDCQEDKIVYAEWVMVVEEDNEYATGSKLSYIQHGNKYVFLEPIAHSLYLGQFAIKGNYAVWRVNGHDSVPIFYDFKADRFIVINEAKEGIYACYLTENHIVFISSSSYESGNKDNFEYIVVDRIGLVE
ncbi:MAG: hypothetical protein FWD34_00615 [Oscillospiraceae bacterium]|nr:hypothetical protein [Oscillospiraceae bacterium]